MPLIFENDVVSKDINNFGVTAGKGYVAFLGDLDASKVRFDVAGEVMIGGTALAKNFHMSGGYGSGGRATALYVLDGGSLTVTNLVDAFNNANNSTLNVLKGGTLSVTGGEFKNQVAVDHSVFGHLSIGVPLSTTASLGFFGKGRVDVASTKSTATAAAVKIGEGVTLCPSAWNTVTADGEGPVTLTVDTHATLGAKADWTYGVATGVSTATAAADRALVINDYETLTVDTEDPDTSVGHVVTFADPVVMAHADVPGALVKKGAGTLRLAASGCSLANVAVTLTEGCFSWAGDKSVASLDAKPGTVLEADADCGCLAVAGTVNLDNVTVRLANKASTVGLQTILTGNFVGTPVAAEGYKVKIVGNELKIASRGGAILIVR